MIDWVIDISATRRELVDFAFRAARQVGPQVSPIGHEEHAKNPDRLRRSEGAI